MLLFYQTHTLYVDEPHVDGVVQADSVESALHTLVDGSQSVQISGISADQFLQELKKSFLYIKAAGGIVTSHGQTLLIYRNERWDLPKGMVEADEEIESAALREVQEETGISDLTLGPLLTTTFHIYNTYGRWTLKQTWWYLMTTPQTAETTPQTAEGITKATWLAPDERHQALSHSYSMMQHIDNLL